MESNGVSVPGLTRVKVASHFQVINLSISIYLSIHPSTSIYPSIQMPLFIPLFSLYIYKYIEIQKEGNSRIEGPKSNPNYNEIRVIPFISAIVFLLL